MHVAKNKIHAHAWTIASLLYRLQLMKLTSNRNVRIVREHGESWKISKRRQVDKILFFKMK